MVKATRWLGLAAISLLCVLGARAAEAADALPFSNSFHVTGNYAVCGVDIQGQSANGFSTGTIHINRCTTSTFNCVPQNADILAAYLYWETIDHPGSVNLDPQHTPVKFRGQPVTDAK